MGGNGSGYYLSSSVYWEKVSCISNLKPWVEKAGSEFFSSFYRTEHTKRKSKCRHTSLPYLFLSVNYRWILLRLVSKLCGVCLRSLVMQQLACLALDSNNIYFLVT